MTDTSPVRHLEQFQQYCRGLEINVMTKVLMGEKTHG